MTDDLTRMAQARVGATLCKKYRIDSLIGVGGMAAVYQGAHRNGNRVAVKILHPHVSLKEEARTRFLREGYVANAVDHPGAVRVLDDDVADDGAAYLVMELLQGSTLDALCEKAGGRVPALDVARWMHQLLDVLAAAHEKGIFHRDIKPENLFLTKESQLKVLDFGIARMQEPAAANAATRTGRMLGTPAYMAPEQALGRSKQINATTDLWAVGATMFSLLSGQFVHEAETLEELLIHAGSRHARSLASTGVDVPKEIVGVVDRATQFDQAERWDSARAMASALQRARRAIEGELHFAKTVDAQRADARFDSAEEEAVPPTVDDNKTPPVLHLVPTFDDVTATEIQRPSPGVFASVGLPKPRADAKPTVTAKTSVPAAPVLLPSMRGTSTTAGTGRDVRRSASSTALQRALAVTTGLVGLVLLAIATVTAIRRHPEASEAAAAGSSSTTETRAVGVLTADPSSPAVASVTSVQPTSSSLGLAGESVEDLPKHVDGQQTPLPQGRGKLLVFTDSGSCNVSVDGRMTGATPVSFDVAAGPHRVTCATQDGQQRQTVVPVPAGATARYQFSLHGSGATQVAAGTVSTSQPNCNPPYTIDAAGHRHVKPECE